LIFVERKQIQTAKIMDKSDLKFEDEQNTIPPHVNSFMNERVFQEDGVVQKKAIITANILNTKITGMWENILGYLNIELICQYIKIYM
jgi:hypothetical protein